MRRLALLVSLSSALATACDGGEHGKSPLEPVPADGGSASDCEGLPDGESTERVRFARAEVTAPEECQSELQTARCQDGKIGAWSGTFEHETCAVLAPGSGDCAGKADGTLVTRTRFAEQMPAPGEACRAEEQVATCVGGQPGTWSGSYGAEACAETALGCGALREGEETTRVRYKRPIASDIEACADMAQTQTGVCTHGELVFDGTYTEDRCVDEYTDACGTLLTSEANKPCMRIPFADQEKLVAWNGEWMVPRDLQLDGGKGHMLSWRPRLGSEYAPFDLSTLTLEETPRETERVEVFERSVYSTVRLTELRHGMRAVYDRSLDQGSGVEVVVYSVDGKLEERLRWKRPTATVASVALAKDALWVATRRGRDFDHYCTIHRVSFSDGAETEMNDQLLDEKGNRFWGQGCALTTIGDQLYIAAVRTDDAFPDEGSMTHVFSYDLASEHAVRKLVTKFDDFWLPEEIAVREGHLLVQAGLRTHIIDLAAPSHVQGVESSGLALLRDGVVYALDGGDDTLRVLGAEGRHIYTLPTHGRAMDLYDGKLFMADSQRLAILDLSRTPDMLVMKQVVATGLCEASGPAVVCKEDSGSLYVSEPEGLYSLRHTFTAEDDLSSPQLLADQRKSAVFDHEKLTVLDHASGQVQTRSITGPTSLRSIDGNSLLYVLRGTEYHVSRRDLDSLDELDAWRMSFAPLLKNGVLWTLNNAGLLSGHAVEKTLPQEPLGTLELPNNKASYYELLTTPLESGKRQLLAVVNEATRLAMLIDVSNPSQPSVYRTFEALVASQGVHIFTSDELALVRSGWLEFGGVSQVYGLEGKADEPLMVYGVHGMDLTRDGRLRVAGGDGVFLSEPLRLPE